MNPIYTIQDHGPECFGLYLHGKRICVVSDCSEETVRRLAAVLNPRDVSLLEQVDRMDEALRAIDAALADPNSATMKGYHTKAVRMVRDVIARAEEKKLASFLGRACAKYVMAGKEQG